MRQLPGGLIAEVNRAGAPGPHHLVLAAAQCLLACLCDLKGLHVWQLVEGHLVTGDLGGISTAQPRVARGSMAQDCKHGSNKQIQVKQGSSAHEHEVQAALL